MEIGDLKRDIAYHGDTVNTAARIHGLCAVLKKRILISKALNELLPDQESVMTKPVGNFVLKGKEMPVELYSIERYNLFAHFGKF